MAGSHDGVENRLSGELVMRPRLLQVCNVGQICGGTAACAWTVAQALPGLDHSVAFLGPIATETHQAFAGHQRLSWPHVSLELVRSVRPDMVLLHNTSTSRVRGTIPVPTVQYIHSRITPAAADVTVYCSRWLAAQFRAAPADVQWQGLPRTCLGQDSSRGTAARSLTVGRLCTPQPRKWPGEIVPFYARLAAACPDVLWEFVGCPAELQTGLSHACGGQVQFWPAGWEQRSLLRRWDVLLYHQPSLTESFGRTVGEAMRVGCVPVVDRLGGFCEQLDAGGGHLCGSPAEFIAALQELTDPETRAACVRTAVRIADERWSLGRFARELLGRFDQAVDVWRTSPRRRGTGLR